MQRYLRLSAIAMAAAVLTLGCANSSHKSVRTYEYREEPVPEQQQPVETESEYEMVSPGEMVGPGEMVDE